MLYHPTTTIHNPNQTQKTMRKKESFTSMRHCAVTLGVPVAEVRRCKLSGESGAFNYHRIDGTKVREWLSANANPSLSTDDANVDWRDRKTKADALYRELQLSKGRDTLVEKHIVQDETAKLIATFFAIVERYVDRVEFSAITEECRAAAIPPDD